MKLALGSQVPVALLLAVFSAGPAGAQTADEVVEKHLAAVGGRAALEKLESRVSTGTISMSLQGTEVSGPAEMYAKAPNKSRTYFVMDLGAEIGELAVDQRCDGKTAWASNSLVGDRDITGAQLQAMLNATFPSSLLAYKQAGAKVELLGKDTIGGRSVHVMEYTPRQGSPTRSYLDAETFLAVRTVSKLESPDLGEVEQRIDLGDYRVVDGIKIPFSLKISNGMQDLTITMNKVEHNKPIDDAMFAKPVK